MQQTSPIIPVTKITKYSFPEAIKAVMDGRRITRLDWNTNDSYGLLKDGFLMIYLEGKFFQWILSDGDMFANDWVLLPEQNEHE